MEDFCRILKELRLDKKISQKKLADIIGTNNSSVCDWECGRTQPNIEMIIKLCLFFDVSADYMFGLEDESGIKLRKKITSQKKDV